MSQRTEIHQIDVDTASQILSIVWGDGEQSYFPLDAFRRVCPCVFCRGGHEHMNQRMDVNEMLVNAKKEWRIKSIKPVGNYAIQITWNDNHNSGLYRFDAIRLLWDEYTDLKKSAN